MFLCKKPQSLDSFMYILSIYPFLLPVLIYNVVSFDHGAFHMHSIIHLYFANQTPFYSDVYKKCTCHNLSIFNDRILFLTCTFKTMIVQYTLHLVSYLLYLIIWIPLYVCFFLIPPPLNSPFWPPNPYLVIYSFIMCTGFPSPSA